MALSIDIYRLRGNANYFNIIFGFVWDFNTIF